jgi:hypothetical protein
LTGVQIRIKNKPQEAEKEKAATLGKFFKPLTPQSFCLKLLVFTSQSELIIKGFEKF